MNAFERARKIVGDRTLVIIDMQERFDALGEECDIIPAICDLVRYAKEKKWAILIVEYAGNGSTQSDILDTIDGYYHCSTVEKNNNNGGHEIIDCLNAKRTWSFDLVVCGIYGDFCVPATVAGLFECSDLVEVDVVTDAVYPDYYSESLPDEYDQQREREVTTNDIVERQNASITENVV